MPPWLLTMSIIWISSISTLVCFNPKGRPRICSMSPRLSISHPFKFDYWLCQLPLVARFSLSFGCASFSLSPVVAARCPRIVRAIRIITTNQPTNNTNTTARTTTAVGAFHLHHKQLRLFEHQPLLNFQLQTRSSKPPVLLVGDVEKEEPGLSTFNLSANAELKTASPSRGGREGGARMPGQGPSFPTERPPGRFNFDDAREAGESVVV